MKSVKNFVFLVLVLSSLVINTFAGDIQTPGAKPAATPQVSMSTTNEETLALDGDSNVDVTTETSDYLFLEALAALLSVY
jgi:hypothetical protein